MEQHIKELFRLAKNEVQVSTYLYKGKYYRQSYYHFQQASELANKAFAVLMDFMPFEKLKSIGHKQHKIYKKQSATMHEQMNTLVDTGFPTLTQHKNWREVAKEFEESIKVVNDFWDQDRTDLTHEELNELITMLVELKEVEVVETNQENVEKGKEKFKALIKKIENANICLPAYDELKKTLEIIIKDDQLMIQYANESMELFNFILRILLKPMMTLWVTASLTDQHNNRTRYIEEDISPLNIYTASLPIVQRQPEFLSYLSIAIDSLENFESNILEYSRKLVDFSDRFSYEKLIHQ